LCLFTALLGILGWGVAREIGRRAHGSRALARALGLVLFIGPLLLVYVSSLGGFYRAEVDGSVVRLRYLLPAVTSEIPLAQITRVSEIPWYRGRWRLVVETASGSTYESASWHRQPIAESFARLQEVRQRGGKE
jgi:hypothetical protein